MVAKQELARIPLLGRAMVTAGHLMIDRAHPARALEAYKDAAELIRGGMSALLFAEGTRSRTGELLPFKNAPFGLAIAAQVPVVPVYVGHTFEIMPKGRFFLRPRPIRIVIGDPIATAGMTVEQRQELRDRVHAAILALKARVDAEGVAR
jgi:1-acyl-sn-glycerol-3-phosphate acyltransferase